MKYLLLLLTFGTLQLSAATVTLFKDVASTNSVKANDLLLVDTALGGTNYLTRTATLSNVVTKSAMTNAVAAPNDTNQFWDGKGGWGTIPTAVVTTNFVQKTGDTMTGALTITTNGLAINSSGSGLDVALHANNANTNGSWVLGTRSDTLASGTVAFIRSQSTNGSQPMVVDLAPPPSATDANGSSRFDITNADPYATNKLGYLSVGISGGGAFIETVGLNGSPVPNLVMNYGGALALDYNSVYLGIHKPLWVENFTRCDGPGLIIPYQSTNVQVVGTISAGTTNAWTLGAVSEAGVTNITITINGKTYTLRAN